MAAALLAFTTAGHAAETTTFSYDALGRLTQSSNSGGPRTGTGSATGYDPAGNRTASSIGQALPPPPPTTAVFSIASAPAVNEGSPAVFTVTRTGAASTTLMVSYATADGSATAPGDYTSANGSLSFLASESQKTIVVPTRDDGIAEPAETFTVRLSSPTGGATIGTAMATGTINASAAANQPPVANIDAASVGVCDTVSVNVVANDTDPEGNYPLVLLSATTTSTKGDARVASSTNVLFSAGGATGSAGVNYTIRDSLGATANGILNINITAGTGCN